MTYPSRSQWTFLALLGASLICLAPLLRGQSVWVGGGPNTNWTTAANWQGGNFPTSGADIEFQGSVATTNNNDYFPGLSINSLAFNPNAASFTLQGGGINFFNSGGTNTITNNSPNTQTLAFDSNAPSGGITNGGVPSVIIDAAAGGFVINTDIVLFNLNSTDSAAQELIFRGAFDTEVDGVISSPINPADVVQLGPGRTILNNDNIFTGDVVIFGGTLAAGSLNALGTRDVFLIGGTLETFNGPRPMAVGRDYVQVDGTLRIQIGGLDSGSESDFLTVGRNAFLGGELFLHRINGFVPVPGDRIPIIGTVNPFGRNGTFDSVSNDFPGLIQPFAEYFDARVDVVFDFANTFSSQAHTPNEKAVGQALDRALSDDCVVELTNFLGNILLNELPNAYDLIAPEELAAVFEVSFSQATVQTMNLQNRMADIRAGSTGFCDSGYTPQVVGNSYSKDGKTVLSDKNPSIMTPTPDNRWGVFITGTGQLVSVGDKDFNAEGYDLTTGGFTTGIDYRVLHNWAIGISAGYSHTDADLAGDGHIGVDGGKIGLYTTFYSGGFYVDAAANGGWNSYDTTRAALLGDERGSTDGAEFSAFIGGGYDWKHNCWILGPTGTFQYTVAEFDSFTEGDTTLAPLHFPEQSQDSLRSTLGLRLAHEHVAKGDGVTFRPEVRASWLHEFGDRGYAIDSNFVGCDDTFTVHGPKIGSDSALVNFGLTVIFNRWISSYLFYNGQFARNNYADSAVSGGLRVSF
jgi:outer membrane autotransporter protein